MSWVSYNKYLLIVALLLLAGCQRQEDSAHDVKLPDGYRQVENPEAETYYIDRARTLYGYKKPVVPMYKTRKLWIGWRPNKKYDDGQIMIDGTWVKFFTGKDEILDFEEPTELIENYSEDRMFYGQHIVDFEDSISGAKSRKKAPTPFHRMGGMNGATSEAINTASDAVGRGARFSEGAMMERAAGSAGQAARRMGI